MDYQHVNCVVCYKDMEIPIYRDRNVICQQCGDRLIIEGKMKRRFSIRFLIEKLWWKLFKKNIF